MLVVDAPASIEKALFLKLANAVNLVTAPDQDSFYHGIWHFCWDFPRPEIWIFLESSFILTHPKKPKFHAAGIDSKKGGVGNLKDF